MIALTGGGTQGFSLWFQSPLPRSFNSLSLFGKLGTRVGEVFRSNNTYLIIFLSIGAVVGLALASLSVFAQASAVGAVAELESGRETGLQRSLWFGRTAFWRVLALTFAYFLLIALLTVPSMVLWSSFGRESEGVFFPCILGVLIGLVFVALTILLSIVYELSCRYAVIRSFGVIGSITAALSLLKESFRETVLAWFSVLIITLTSTFAMVVLVAALGSPLNWLFTYIYDHHNWLLMALGLLVSVLTWVFAVAAAGLFSVSASAVWTVSFMEFENCYL